MLTNWFAFLLHKFLKVSAPTNVRRCLYMHMQIHSLYLFNKASRLKMWLCSLCFQSGEVSFFHAGVLCHVWTCGFVCLHARVGVHRSVQGSRCSCCTAPSSSRWKRGPLTPSPERPATPWAKTSSSASRSSTKPWYVTHQQTQQKFAQRLADMDKHDAARLTRTHTDSSVSFVLSSGPQLIASGFLLLISHFQFLRWHWRVYIVVCLFQKGQSTST